MSDCFSRGRVRFFLLLIIGAFVSSARAEELSVSGEGEVSLSELLAFADDHAPSLGVSARRQGYASAERAGADPLFLSNPTVEFGFGPRFDAGTDLDFDFFAAVSQPMGLARERGARREVADRLGDRLQAETASARLALHRELTLLYRAAVIARERARLGQERSAFAREMLDIAHRRLQAGDVSRIDVQLAEAEWAVARGRELSEREEYRALRVRLTEVSGWPMDHLVDVSPGLPAPEALPELEAVLRASLERHPELVARRAAIAEIQSRATVANRQAAPKPVMGARLAREGSAGSPANYIVLGTVGLPLPFWQKNQGERRRLGVEEEIARAEESLALRSLRARIAVAHGQLSAARERVALFLEGAIPSTQESVQFLRRGFEAGELTLLNVAVARERFIGMEQQMLDAYADYYRALAELEFLAGDGRTGLWTATGDGR